MNDYQSSFSFTPTYGDVSTYFYRRMISVVVIFYSNTRQSVLMDYAVTEMGCFGDYLGAAPHVKKIRRNGITTSLLHVAQFITFIQNKLSQQHLLTKE